MNLDHDRIHDLLCQALETEHGGIAIYETAIGCAVHDDLRAEWNEYLDQTRGHAKRLRKAIEEAGFDPDAQTPGRASVRIVGEALVAAMQSAAQSAPPGAAECVAAECVVLAETKDHMNWELICKLAAALDGRAGTALAQACEAVEDEEDQHLYHTRGWARELALHGLGLPAVLPPPEEAMQVTTAIGAARAKASRESMIDPRINAR